MNAIRWIITTVDLQGAIRWANKFHVVHSQVKLGDSLWQSSGKHRLAKRLMAFVGLYTAVIIYSAWIPSSKGSFLLVKEKKTSQPPTEWPNQINCKITPCNCQKRSAKMMQSNSNWMENLGGRNQTSNCYTRSTWQLQDWRQNLCVGSWTSGCEWPHSRR